MCDFYTFYKVFIYLKIEGTWFSIDIWRIRGYTYINLKVQSVFITLTFIHSGEFGCTYVCTYNINLNIHPYKIKRNWHVRTHISHIKANNSICYRFCCYNINTFACIVYMAVYITYVMYICIFHK